MNTVGAAFWDHFGPSYFWYNSQMTTLSKLLFPLNEETGIAKTALTDNIIWLIVLIVILLRGVYCIGNFILYVNTDRRFQQNILLAFSCTNILRDKFL